MSRLIILIAAILLYFDVLPEAMLLVIFLSLVWDIANAAAIEALDKYITESTRKMLQKNWHLKISARDAWRAMQ